MKQIWKWIIVVPIVAGIIIAGSITVKNQTKKFDEKNRLKNVFENLASKPAQVTKFYTYGTALNIEGKIEGISKDNFEGAKIIVRDGEDYEKIYNLNCEFEENNIVFSTKENMNKAIDLEDLAKRRKILCSSKN